MTETFKKGDKVEWETPQGTTIGKIKEKLTSL
jgi:Hypervirulence associated proteins TUDOR domain